MRQVRSSFRSRYPTDHAPPAHAGVLHAIRVLAGQRSALTLYLVAIELKPADNGESYSPQGSESPDPELPPLTTTSERRLMAKIDWHILPCLCVLYLLAFLDR